MHDNERYTIDSNILLATFSIEHKTKQQRAINILERLVVADTQLCLQSLVEFYQQVTRHGFLTPEIAKSQIDDWQILFPTLTEKPTTLNHALRLMSRYTLTLPQALFLATAKEGGVTLIVSDRFPSGWSLEGIRTLDPFLTTHLSADHILS